MPPPLTKRRLGVLRTVLGVAAGLCLLASAPCMFFGALGLLGVLADVSVAENRAFGLQFLGMAAVPLLIGAALLVVAIRLRPAPRVCASCGYDLRGGHERCPECGAAAATRVQ